MNSIHIVCSILPKYIAMAKCSTSSSSGWAKLFDMAKVSFSLQVEAPPLGGGQLPPALYRGGKALNLSTIHPSKSFPANVEFWSDLNSLEDWS